MKLVKLVKLVDDAFRYVLQKVRRFPNIDVNAMALQLNYEDFSQIVMEILGRRLSFGRHSPCEEDKLSQTLVKN